MKVKHKKAHFSITSGLHSASCRLSDYQPPLPPFFFFGGAFFRVAPEAAGFCCRGGTTLLPAAVVDPDPGLGEVGGLLAVLLASLKKMERVNPQRRKLQRRRRRRSLTGPMTLLLSLPGCLFLSAPSSCPSSCLCSRRAPSWEATSRGQGSHWGRSFWAVFLKQIRRNLTGSHTASVQSQRFVLGLPYLSFSSSSF